MKCYSLIFTLLGGGLLSLSSCQNETEERISEGSEYFPVNFGATHEYEVREIVWDDFTNTSDTSIYNITETISGSFIDNAGDTMIRIELSKYDSSAGHDAIYKVYTSKLDAYDAKVIQDNICYVKLSFPIVKNKTWDGNVYNDEKGSKDYKYIKVFEPYDNGYRSFAETVTVREALDISNSVKMLSKRSVYAKNVGLVYHEDIDFEVIVKNVNGIDEFVRKGTETYITLK